MLHDGGRVHLRRVDEDYNPTDRGATTAYIRKHQAKGEIVTGLLYIDDEIPDLHGASDTADVPLSDLDFETLNPGSKALEEIQEAWN